MHRPYQPGDVRKVGMILESELVQKIEEAKGRLDKSKIPDFVLQVRAAVHKQARDQAAVLDEDNREREREVIASYDKAWDYLLENYQGKITLDLLLEAGGRIEPKLANEERAHIRDRSCVMKGMRYRPPTDQVRIQRDLDRMFEVLEESNLHPVEYAAYSHFHLVRIQPLLNGNKRTASILMNAHLWHHNLAPISLPSSERGIYIALFSGACAGFEEKQSQGESALAYRNFEFQQQGFFTYLGSKVLSNLKCAEKQLFAVPRYVVTMPHSTPGELYTTKGRIDSWFRHLTRSHHLSLDKKAHSIHVIGDIPYESLQELVEKKNGHNGKYQIITAKP